MLCRLAKKASTTTKVSGERLASDARLLAIFFI